jgi:hypothetical protein
LFWPHLKASVAKRTGTSILKLFTDVMKPAP